jgi:Matrixin
VESDGFGPEKPFDDVPRSPTGRVPQWVLDEASGTLSRLTEPGSSYPLAEAMQSTGPRRPRWVRASILLVLAFVGAAAMLTATGTWKPLLRFATNADSYRFFALQNDGKTPVAYDPCQPIHYVIRQQGEPTGADPIVFTAVARISQATGLQFVFDGTTSEAPSSHRSSHQLARYGNRWAPVLISWTTAREDPDFANAEVLGEGGSGAVRVPSGARVFVTGAVTLDAEKLAKILKQDDGDQIVRAVVLHELGHVVGLDHVETKGQLMYARNQRGVTDFGAGDLTGLAALGRGGCFPTL